MYNVDLPIELRPVCEVQYVQGIAAASASGIYGESRVDTSIIGRAKLTLGEKVRPVLDSLASANSRFRAIRHSVTWNPHPEVENTAYHREIAGRG